MFSNRYAPVIGSLTGAVTVISSFLPDRGCLGQPLDPSDPRQRSILDCVMETSKQGRNCESFREIEGRHWEGKGRHQDSTVYGQEIAPSESAQE